MKNFRKLFFLFLIAIIVPTAKQVLLSMDTRENDSKNNAICSICQNEDSIENSFITLPCDGKHAFHEKCIVPWLETHDTCPNCRENGMFPKMSPQEQQKLLLLQQQLQQLQQQKRQKRQQQRIQQRIQQQIQQQRQQRQQERQEIQQERQEIEQEHQRRLQQLEKVIQQQLEEVIQQPQEERQEIELLNFIKKNVVPLGMFTLISLASLYFHNHSNN